MKVSEQKRRASLSEDVSIQQLPTRGRREIEHHGKPGAWPSAKSLLKGAIGALLLFEPSARGVLSMTPGHAHRPLSDLPFGLELEFLGMGADRAAVLMYDEIGSLAEPQSSTHFHYNTWQIRQDAVLDEDGVYVAGNELVSPILHDADVPTISRLSHSLEAHGARTSPGCGVHVHLAGNPFDAHALLGLTSLVYRFEDQILGYFNVSDHRRQNYAQPLAPEFVSRLRENFPADQAGLRWAWYETDHQASAQQLQQEHLQSRNHGLNLHAFFVRGTVELRYFEGTTHGPALISIVDFSRRLGLWALHNKHAVTELDFRPAMANSGGPIENLFALLQFTP